MKKALVILFTSVAFACQNPEDGATAPTADTATNYQENQVLNTPPGVTSPDTSSAKQREENKVDTSAKH